MRIFIALVAIAVFVVSPLLAEASLELVEEYTFTATPLDYSISRISLGTPFGTSPFALVTDGETLLLYSLAYSTEAFVWPIELPDDIVLRDHNILLADVNCDQIGDIVLVTFTDFVFDASAGDLVTKLEITVFSGATGFQQTDKVIVSYPADNGNYLLFGSATTMGITALEAYDIDGNGLKNLLVSYDHAVCTDCTIPYYVVVESIGVFHPFGCFPISTSWEGELALSHIKPIDPAVNPAMHVAYRHEYLAVDGHGFDPYYQHTMQSIVFNAGGGFTIDFNPSVRPNACNGDEIVASAQGFRGFEAGNIIPVSPENELIAISRWSETCLRTINGEPVEIDTSGCEILAYRTVGGKPADVLWRVDYNGSLSNLGYIPEHPTHFFGIDGNKLVQFAGTDGSIVGEVGTIPQGTRLWARPYGDDRVRLVVVADKNVSIYRIDQTTDTPQSPDEPVIPDGFTVHQPYPNPFNSSLTIPVSLDQANHLTVQIYNLLGQKVTTIWDSYTASGEYVLQWNGTDDCGHSVSTGIYLIRGTTPLSSQSVKCLLIK